MSYSLAWVSSIVAAGSPWVLAAVIGNALLLSVPRVPCSRAWCVVEEPSAMIRVAVVFVSNTLAIVVLRACQADCEV